MFKKVVLTMVFAILMLPMYSFAGVFDIHIQSEGQTYDESFSSISDVIDNLDTDEIKSNISAYTDTSAASLRINFRGVPINLSIAANSNKIVLSIPSINVNEEFEGADRDASVDLIEDWLKENGEAAVTRLMKELVATTATDPVAGNPASLQARMVAMDYGYAVNTDEVIEMNTAPSQGTINANMISVFARYSNYDLDGTSSKEYSLPLAYTVKFNGSKNSLSFRVPISMVSVDGSDAYNFGLGIGFSYFVTDDWSLTPSGGYSAVGSVDLGSVAQLVNTSLTSAYNFHIDKYTLTMGNMVGYYKTIPFTYGEYSIDPDIKNQVLRNGLNLNIPTNGIMKGTSMELFVTDTRYFGSELYIDQYNEIGISYGFAKMSQKAKGDKIKNLMRKARIGFTYLLADNASGYTVNFGFSF